MRLLTGGSKYCNQDDRPFLCLNCSETPRSPLANARNAFAWQRSPHCNSHIWPTWLTFLHPGNAAPSTLKGNWPGATLHWRKLQVRHGLVLAMLLHGINRRTARLTSDLVGRTSLHAGKAAPSTLKGNWPEATFYSRKLQVRVGLVPATFLRGIDRRTATLTSALVGRTSLHPGNGPASTLKRNRPGATFHDPSQVRYALRCLQQKDKCICLSRSRPATYFSAVIASGPNRASLETKNKNELRN